MGDIIDVNAVFGGMPSAPTDAGLDSLLQALEQHDITACCALSTIGVYLDHAIGNGASRAASVRSARLVPVATINPTRCIGDLTWIAGLAGDGYRMVRLFPAEQGWEPEDAAFGAVLMALSRNSLPLMVDAGKSAFATRFMRAVGEYPGNVVLSGVSVQTLAEAIALMRFNPRIYVETSNLLAYGAVRTAVDAASVDRVLFGTGAPVRPIASSLALVREAGLSASDLGLVLFGNARRALSV